jgi:ABC-type nitrate/sulfonate/bicarbonate transport system substrate-binding protein
MATTSIWRAAKALCALALGVLLAQPASAQTIEKKDVKLGVGGKTGLYYLPLAVAEFKGLFKEEGSTSRSTISPAARGPCRRWSAARSTW